MKLDFADGLNCIIGARWTGKTTVLEFIRYVLGLVPDQKKSAAMARAINNLVQGNLKNGRRERLAQPEDDGAALRCRCSHHQLSPEKGV